jgi:hypothetical protein
MKISFSNQFGRHKRFEEHIIWFNVPSRAFSLEMPLCDAGMLLRAHYEI